MSFLSQPILKFWSLEIDKEMKNVNKRGQEVTKHIELWVKNVFDEWKLFCGFDTTKSIVDLSKDEGLIKDLVDMLSSFILQVAKKDGSLYWRQSRIILDHFLNVYIILFFSLCSSFCLIYAFANYVFLFVIRFRVYV